MQSSNTKRRSLLRQQQMEFPIVKGHHAKTRTKVAGGTHILENWMNISEPSADMKKAWIVNSVEVRWKQNNLMTAKI